jgi:surface protein
VAGTNITIIDNIISSSGGGDVSQSDLALKQDLINISSNLTAGALSVYTDRLKSSEELDTLIFRLIEQYFSPTYKPTSYVVIKAAVEYFYDNTLELPGGTNNTQASINNMTKWDVSTVPTLEGVFALRENFNENISAWNVSLVTTLSTTFYRAFKFNQPVGNWNVSKVTDMFLTFQACYFFNQDISNWDVSNVTTLQFTFNSCFAYNQPMGNWNVAKVTSMNGTFQLCSAFNQDISNWDVSNVTDMRVMFKDATSFNQDIRAWNISKVSNTNLANMFSGATAMLAAYPILSTTTGIRNWFASTAYVT